MQPFSKSSSTPTLSELEAATTDLMKQGLYPEGDRSVKRLVMSTSYAGLGKDLSRIPLFVYNHAIFLRDFQ